MTRGALVAGACLLLVSAATACSSSAPQVEHYTFDPQHAGVKVDTPGLRTLKATAGIAPCPASPSAPDAKSSDLPLITLPCLGGGRDVELAGLRGPLLLNFWSQTCGPCRQESPLLQRFSVAAAGKVSVMGVDFFDPRPALALEFAKAYGLTYPQVADPDAATKADLHIAGLPTTLLVDSAGRVTYTQVGAVTSAAQLSQLVRAHLGVTVQSGSSR